MAPTYEDIPRTVFLTCDKAHKITKRHSEDIHFKESFHATPQCPSDHPRRAREFGRHAAIYAAHGEKRAV
jgi:hypothetical protein